MFESIVSYDIIVNRSEQSLQNTTDRIWYFLKGAGLKLSERNISRYFTSRICMPISSRTALEIYYRIKEEKRLQRKFNNNYPFKVIFRESRARLLGG